MVFDGKSLNQRRECNSLKRLHFFYFDFIAFFRSQFVFSSSVRQSRKKSSEACKNRFNKFVETSKVIVALVFLRGHTCFLTHILAPWAKMGLSPLTFAPISLKIWAQIASISCQTKKAGQVPKCQMCRQFTILRFSLCFLLRSNYCNQIAQQIMHTPFLIYSLYITILSIILIQITSTHHNLRL